jgi:hypothetical protein
MSDERITQFPGITRTDLPKNEQPCLEVIEFLEGLLEKAKRGEIQAIGVAYVRPDNVTGEGYSHNGYRGHDLMGAITDLFYRACRVRYESKDAPEFNHE